MNSKKQAVMLSYIRQLTSRGLLLTSLLLVTVVTQAEDSSVIWFAKAGSSGDGLIATSPLGSTAEIEQKTRPGDTIFLLPSHKPFEGGLALKKGQTLIGLPESGQQPQITNTNSKRHGGVGILLADSVRVSNIRVEDTVASGVFGRNISAQVDGVTVYGANRSQRLLDLNRTLAPLYPPPHGGIVLVQTTGDTEVTITDSSVIEATGVGILSVNFGTALSRLSVLDSRVHGGSPMGFYDTAIAALVRDSTARVWLNVADSELDGRMSQSGRNVMVEAAGGAMAKARVERTRIGPTGQDGILATSLQSPAVVDLFIVDSVVERAGQMNVEGTVLNFPPDDAQPKNEGRVSITIERSMIRSATSTSNLEQAGINIWLGPSGGIDELPQAVGNYQLTVRDSQIENAERAGIVISELGAKDKGTYRATLRGSTIVGNGETEVAVFAPDARIDARGNCWGRPEGLNFTRVVVLKQAVTQLDASDPIDCSETGKD